MSRLRRYIQRYMSGRTSDNGAGTMRRVESRFIAGLRVSSSSFISVSQLLKLPNIDRKHETPSQHDDQETRNRQ